MDQTHISIACGSLSGFKISVDIGTTRPSRIRLDHGRYRTDTRVGYFVEQTRLN